jgi:lactaldehyde reductase
MRFNAEATGEKYRDIARAMGVRVEALSLSAARWRQWRRSAS